MALTLAAAVPAARAAGHAKSRIEFQPLAPGIELVAGAGSNAARISGEGAAVLVDGGTPDRASDLLRALRTGKVPDTLINTHWHRDHTGCNEALGKAGATIWAHEYTKQWMQRPIRVAWNNESWPPMPRAAWPTRTFLAEERLQLAGRELRLGYMPQAHTDGDLYVHLPDANVLIVGDVVSVGSYPMSDVATGGWIRGMLNACKQLLPLCDERTRIVPGTGAVVDKVHLQAQHDMLETLTERIWQLMRKGMSEVDIVALRPTEEYDAHWGEPRQFVLNTYQGIWNHVREMRGIV